MPDPIAPTPAAPPPPPPPLLSVRRLSVDFPSPTGGVRTRVVDDVSFELAPGRSLGIVGESGSGKTTVARAILRLIPAAGGQVLFGGADLLHAGGERTPAMRAFRRQAQIIFQDPAGSLNPRHRVEAIVGEPLIVHGLASGDALRKRVGDLLERCGLNAEMAGRYPHEFSGGQRQRIAIARAIAIEPKLLVCDEPTSALDVSIQAQILNLLKDLQSDLGLSYLFISHDLAVVRHMCDRVAVMLKGKIIEQGDADAVLVAPTQDYTKALLAAVPAGLDRR